MVRTTQEWIPSALEKYVADVEVDGQLVELALWDHSGMEEYDRVRPLSYSGADVVLMCFAIDSPDSLDNVQGKVCGFLMSDLAFVPGANKEAVDVRSPKVLQKYTNSPRWTEEGTSGGSQNYRGASKDHAAPC